MVIRAITAFEIENQSRLDIELEYSPTSQTPPRDFENQNTTEKLPNYSEYKHFYKECIYLQAQTSKVLIIERIIQK